jgi:hypothetical protein
MNDAGLKLEALKMVMAHSHGLTAEKALTEARILQGWILGCFRSQPYSTGDKA